MTNNIQKMGMWRYLSQFNPKIITFYGMGRRVMFRGCEFTHNGVTVTIERTGLKSQNWKVDFSPNVDIFEPYYRDYTVWINGWHVVPIIKAFFAQPEQQFKDSLRTWGWFDFKKVCSCSVFS